MFENKTPTFQVKIFAISEQSCSKNFLALPNVSLVPWAACGANLSNVQQFGPTDFRFCRKISTVYRLFRVKPEWLRHRLSLSIPTSPLRKSTTVVVGLSDNIPDSSCKASVTC